MYSSFTNLRVLDFPSSVHHLNNKRVLITDWAVNIVYGEIQDTMIALKTL